ncbi:MAG: hypothetical protein ACE148_07675 [Vicinamibacterales bacterium]
MRALFEPLPVILLVVAGLVVTQADGLAQQRPLTTQDPEPIGAGRVLVEGGFDYGTDVFFPASGLTGDLLRAPLIGVNVGISSIADLQLSGGLFNRLAVDRAEAAPLSGMLDPLDGTTSDVEDIVLATKVLLISETDARPAFAVHFATRLPNASNESGLGLDTIDFIVTAAGAKTVTMSTRIAANLGLGVLGNPLRGDSQNDVLVGAVSVARTVSDAVEVVGEVSGRINTSSSPPPGTENRGLLKAGTRFKLGAGRLDAAILVGLTARDPSIGVAAGYTRVFDAFTIR